MGGIGFQGAAIPSGRLLGRVEVQAAGVAEPDRQHGGAVAVAAGRLGEQLGEDVPAAAGRQQLQERVDADGRRSEFLLVLAPAVDGRGGIGEGAGLETRDALQIVAPLVVAHRRVHASPQGRDERRPPLGGGEHLAEAVEGLAVGRVGLEAALPGRGRAVELAEPRAEARQGAERVAAIAGTGSERRQTLEDLQAVGAAIRCFEPLVEPAQRTQAIGPIGRRLAPRPRVKRDRALAVGEQPLVHVRGLEQQRHPAPLVRRAGRRRGEPLRVGAMIADLGALTPQQVLHLAVIGGKPEQRRQVVRGLAPGPRGGEPPGRITVQRRQVVSLREGEPGPHHRQRAVRAAVTVVARRDQAQRLEAQPDRQALERHQPRPELETVPALPRLREQPPRLGQRLGRRRQPLDLGGRDAHAQGPHLVAHGAIEARAPKRDQIHPPLLTFEETLQRARHLPVAGLERGQLLQVADGAVGVTREILGDLRRLLEQLHAPAALRHHRERAIVDGEQLRPALRQRQQHNQALARPVRGGLHLQHPFEDVDQQRRLVGQPFLVKAGGALAEGRQQDGRVRLVQRPPVGLGHRARAVVLDGRRLQPLPTGNELGRLGDRLQRGGDGLGQIPSPLVVRRGDLSVHRRPPLHPCRRGLSGSTPIAR